MDKVTILPSVWTMDGWMDQWSIGLWVDGWMHIGLELEHRFQLIVGAENLNSKKCDF